MTATRVAGLPAAVPDSRGSCVETTHEAEALTFHHTDLLRIRQDGALVSELVGLTTPRGTLRGWLGVGLFGQEPPPHPSWVALVRSPERVVGWAVAGHYKHSPESVLLGWYVHPDHRRRGLARTLTEALIKSLSGAAIVEIVVQPDDAVVATLLKSCRLVDPGLNEYSEYIDAMIPIRYARYALG